MKKILKSLEFCIGVHIIDLISIIFIGFIGSIFITDYKAYFSILKKL